MEPFWLHFGSILGPFAIRNRSFGALSRLKSVPGGLLKTALIFIDFSRSPRRQGERRLTRVGVLWPRGETTDFEENPAGSRVPALVARMGLGSVSIGSFASYGKYKLACIFADLLRSVGGSMISNAAGTA